MIDEPVRDAMGQLGRPVEPPPEFADELFRRLVHDLQEERKEPRPRTRAVRLWLRTPMLAAAALVAFALVLWVVTSVFTKTSPRRRPANPIPTPTASTRQFQGRAIVPVGSRPLSPAVGFGSMWVADSDGAKGVVEGAPDDTDFTEGHIDRFSEVTRIDLATNRVVAHIHVPSYLLAVGDDAVWVDDQLGKTVSRIDPSTNTVVATINLEFSPSRIATGFGSVWVVGFPESGGPSTLARIDPSTNAIVAQIPVGTLAQDVTVGEDAVWVTDTQTSKLYRIDPSADQVVSSATIGKNPSGAAAGEGAVWVADPVAGFIYRVDPETLRVVGKTEVPRRDDPQVRIAVGGGRVWYADHDSYAVLSIHPEDNRVDGKVIGAAAPNDLVYEDGVIWVTNFDLGTVTRINL